MKIFMLPISSQLGIGRVVDAYKRHLPSFGVQFVDNEEQADLVVCHAGTHADHRQTDVLICHGLYPTATLDKTDTYYQANADVIRNAREALSITVPSNWVAMPFKRDMALNPHVVPHGLDIEDWPVSTDNQRYILWGKGHNPGVCDSTVVNDLAGKLPSVNFITTFGKPSHNVEVIGTVPFREMRRYLSKAGVYLASTKETFGIQTLEAMACGVPVVGYRHGATTDIIEHGVSGWLVKPGDIDGLVDGVDWAVRNRRAVGAAARERVQEHFTWQAACQHLYKVLEEALAAKHNDNPLVSVIIPCYNYGKWVGVAIDSVLCQTYKGPIEIIVVDDGSTDDTEQAVARYGNNVKYLKKPNGGVASARNYGVRYSKGNLIACLDADDKWKPNFLADLLPPMLADRSLGLAYGKLEADNGKGTYISDWPPEFDFSEQAARHNRVPSSCLYRRSAWERAGGYRAQYTPAEDAELWLRIAAEGYNVRRVTDHVTYTYRLHSHSLSRTIAEPNWVDDKPYHGNKALTPFAAPANGVASYPFRDYDDPWISVIIPVGPGHDNLVSRALDSIQSQSVLNWEAVVVNDSGADLIHQPTGLPLSKVYPYIIEARTAGRLGAAKARNIGVQQSHANLLLFLDADDWLLPGCLSRLVEAYNGNPCNYIYMDWMGYDGHKLSQHTAKDFSIQAIMKEAIHPITALVPKAWHQDIGGFDEKIDGWEDWVYYLDMVSAGHCGVRLPFHGMVYDYSSGMRRDDSLSKRNALLPQIRQRYKERSMACSSCGRRSSPSGPARSVQNAPVRASSVRGVAMATKEPEQQESKMVTVQENSGNQGAHGVVGVRTRINYGRHKQGDIFQMHIEDQMAQPQRYVKVAAVQAQEPIPVRPEPPLPQHTPEPVPLPPEPPQAHDNLERDAEILQRAAQPVADDEIEVDITILPLVQIKQLDLSAEDAEAALELERSAPKPRKSVLDYLEGLIK